MLIGKGQQMCNWQSYGPESFLPNDGKVAKYKALITLIYTALKRFRGSVRPVYGYPWVLHYDGNM